MPVISRRRFAPSRLPFRFRAAKRARGLHFCRDASTLVALLPANQLDEGEADA
jgi:hypothetical protein